MSKCERDTNGNKIWRNENGKYHREDGPAVEWNDGTKFWYINGKRHRDDGPAIEWSNGDKSWYQYDKLHREDGPAIEYWNGYKMWHYHDESIKCNSNEEYLKIIKMKAFW